MADAPPEGNTKEGMNKTNGIVQWTKQKYQRLNHA